MTLYHDQIMDHYRHPRNHGCEFSDTNHHSHRHNPSCGDRISVKMQVKDEVIEHICFEGSGCALSTASSSMLTEYVKGRTVSEVLALDHEIVRSLLAIPITTVRMKCALLPLEAIREALL